MESGLQRPKFQVKENWFRGVLIALVLVWTLQLILVVNRRRKTANFPPGPPRWPVIGNLLALGKMAHHDMARLSRQYGELMYLKLGVVNSVVVSSPEMAKEFFKVQDSVFSGRPRGAQSKIVFYDSKDLILAVGDHWRFIRKIAAVELFSPKRVKEFADARSEEILITATQILKKGKVGEPIKADAELLGLSFNNITRLLFGKTYYGAKATGEPADSAEFQRLIIANNAAGFLVIEDFLPFLKFLDLGGTKGKMKKNGAGFDAFLSKILKEHRRKEPSKERGTVIVDALLQIQKEEPALKDATIKGLLLDMLLAGAETVSDVEQWALTELMRHPDILEKVTKELDAVVGRGRLVDEADLVHLTYLQAVVNEIFRLHPVLPFLVPHESLADTKVAGYDIPKGTRVFFNTYGMGRDPKIWEDPLTFNPDRFLNSPINAKGQCYELTPFGSGRRICVGLNYAVILVELTLAQLLHLCDFSLPHGMKPSDVDVEESFGDQITVPKLRPLEIVAKPRLPLHVYSEAGITF
ncbi:hypothetical protein R1sor_008677 [Riccia sorocarpa]|uniref:Cytochrome P450 n=1 Tax=Riccia sorocarpa TaxID=122646 RepID=A0ABD3HVS6_9MARC